MELKNWNMWVDNIIENEDPQMFLGLEEYIIADMTRKILVDGKTDDAQEVIDIINSNVYPTSDIQPFLDSGRDRIAGAVETLKTLKTRKYLDYDPKKILAQIEDVKHDHDKLELVAHLGAHIIAGNTKDITYELEEGKTRNWIMGAKKVCYIIAKSHWQITI
jgi:hypothetical protein